LPLNSTNAINAVEAAVKRGEITEQRIDESVRRLLKAKYRIGLTQNTQVDLTKVNQLVENPENVREANSIAEKSITLLRNASEMLPLSVEKANRTLFVVVAADDDPVEGATFMPEVQRRAQNAKILRLDYRNGREDFEKTIAETGSFDSIVLAVFVKRTAGKGTVALPENLTNFVQQTVAMKDKNVAVIAFGSPYLIRQFPDAKVYAVTYAIEDVAQNAAVRTLFGEVPFQGKLPVRIPNLFEIGAGITK
jgi:beta-N-acetylhexosaminidase